MTPLRNILFVLLSSWLQTVNNIILPSQDFICSFRKSDFKWMCLLLFKVDHFLLCSIREMPLILNVYPLYSSSIRSYIIIHNWAFKLKTKIIRFIILTMRSDHKSLPFSRAGKDEELYGDSVILHDIINRN